MSKQSVLWVVEIKEKGVWVPTVGAYLSRSCAREDKFFGWEMDYPNDKFRIVKYIRES